MEFDQVREAPGMMRGGFERAANDASGGPVQEWLLEGP